MPTDSSGSFTSSPANIDSPGEATRRVVPNLSSSRSSWAWLEAEMPTTGISVARTHGGEAGASANPGGGLTARVVLPVRP